MRILNYLDTFTFLRQILTTNFFVAAAGEEVFTTWMKDEGAYPIIMTNE